MTRAKEVAKFFSGFEAFHAIVHGYLWLSGMTITLVGITARPAWSFGALLFNAAVALVLGFWAWRRPTVR